MKQRVRCGQSRCGHRYGDFRLMIHGIRVNPSSGRALGGLGELQQRHAFDPSPPANTARASRYIRRLQLSRSPDSERNGWTDGVKHALLLVEVDEQHTIDDDAKMLKNPLLVVGFDERVT
uniref:Uncharacterized protein n=1 Tax=Anopheles melas TaxID=34690 RepID=A0A182U0Z7_9DIPT